MELLKDKCIMTLKGQQVKNVDRVLKDELLALFFCSSWCLATRQFLPLFKQFCADVKKRKGHFKVICVPFDKTEDDMWRYYKEMPDDWMTLSLKEEVTIMELRKKYKVNVVPKLLVLNTDDGEALSQMARKEIQDKGIAAYRFWYDTFRPPLMRRKMKAAVMAVMIMGKLKGSDTSLASGAGADTSATPTQAPSKLMAALKGIGKTKFDAPGKDRNNSGPGVDSMDKKPSGLSGSKRTEKK